MTAVHATNTDGITDMSDVTSDTSSVDLHEPAASLPAPRTRWAAVIWGLALASIAAGVLWIVTSAARRAEFVDWLTALSPAAIGGYCVLAVGALVLVSGLVGLIRRTQRRAHDAHPASR